MGRKTVIEWAAEDTAEALHAQYRAEAEPEVRLRLHALWLVRRGETPTAAAAAVGADRTSVQRWLRWYREGGLVDRGISWTNQAVIPVCREVWGPCAALQPAATGSRSAIPGWGAGIRSGIRAGAVGPRAGAALAEGGGLWNGGAGVRRRGATGSAGRRPGRGPAWGSARRGPTGGCGPAGGGGRRRPAAAH